MKRIIILSMIIGMALLGIALIIVGCEDGDDGPVLPVATPTPSCTGYEYLGKCWYTVPGGMSCRQVCDAHGGLASGMETFWASHTLDDCVALLKTLTNTDSSCIRDNTTMGGDACITGSPGPEYTLVCYTRFTGGTNTPDNVVPTGFSSAITYACACVR